MAGLFRQDGVRFKNRVRPNREPNALCKSMKALEACLGKDGEISVPPSLANSSILAWYPGLFEEETGVPELTPEGEREHVEQETAQELEKRRNAGHERWRLKGASE